MTILNAILQLRDAKITSQQDAERFLARFQPEIQKAIISALYIGRDHLDKDSLRDDVEMSTAAVNFLHKEDFAKILFSMRGNKELYISQLLICSDKSDFDLNNIKII